jgi:16S rRNA (guanine527-N7)-methyltransferase
MTDPRPDPDLTLIFERSRDRGFVGPGAVTAHIAHARSYLEAVGPSFAGVAVDLGSGGGLPGLALARWWPGSQWALVDANLRRTEFLAEAAEALGLADRVDVRHARAESFAREAAWRGRVDLVVARSFGPPAVVAECAAPLLVVGGRLVVSEPPEGDAARWPASGLAELGLGLEGSDRVGGHRLARMRQVAPAPGRYPRRVGVPERSPLF